MVVVSALRKPSAVGSSCAERASAAAYSLAGLRTAVPNHSGSAGVECPPSGNPKSPIQNPVDSAAHNSHVRVRRSHHGKARR